jgi:signal transduction histidine kinase
LKIRSEDLQRITENPIELFYQGIKSKETKEKYTRTLRRILCDIFEDLLYGSFEERAAELVRKAKGDQNWIMSVLLTLSSDGKTANLVVKDNGLGIPKDKLGNLFVKFYQITSTQERKYGCSGLGLSVCKEIIDGHHGKIWAESLGENAGSEFHIVLPLKQPQ